MHNPWCPVASSRRGPPRSECIMRAALIREQKIHVLKVRLAGITAPHGSDRWCCKKSEAA